MSSTSWANNRLSGWGRYPIVETRCARPERHSEAREIICNHGDDDGGLLAHGLGRSYGDAALIEDGSAVLTRRLDRMLDFDPAAGVLDVEAGVSLAEILDIFVPRGWFPPVVPGTKFVTVGGAIGCNIHGKNHVHAGCFGDHVRSIELLCADGQIRRCGPDQHEDLFWATVGGMGLTGLILSAEIELYSIDSGAIVMESTRFENLAEFYEVSREYDDWLHTVAWIDCTTSGDRMGRGIFMAGRHASGPEAARVKSGIVDRIAAFGQQLVDGRAFESNLLLNKASIRAFNELYFRRHPAGTKRSVVSHEPFFFPLDAVDNWNYIYGDRGFLQYQLVVDDREAIRAVLTEITDSGMASFLAVLKEFGDHDHGGLSFPCAGTTLALDFPNYGTPVFELMDRLDTIVADAGGRLYLGKDARLSRDQFRRMYPQWNEWKAVRDEWDPDRVFCSELAKRLGL